MTEAEQFEKLKQRLLSETDKHMKYISSLTFDELDTDKAGADLAEVHRIAVDRSIAFTDFIAKKRLRAVFNKLRYG